MKTLVSNPTNAQLAAFDLFTASPVSYEYDLNGTNTYSGIGKVDASSYILRKDIRAKSFRLRPGIVLETGGYRLLAEDFITIDGTIQNCGNNSNGALFGTLGGGADGATCRARNHCRAENVCMVSSGGAGGGLTLNGVVYAGGGGGSPLVNGLRSSIVGITKTLHDILWIYHGFASRGPIIGGGGGGSGSSQGAFLGASGGGGGGVIFIGAPVVNGAGFIYARGANGLAATSGDAGGGGGGGGGLIVLITADAVARGSLTTDAMNGYGGAGSGVGEAGLDGTAGLVMILDLV
jgi:hypothetical protein